MNLRDEVEKIKAEGYSEANAESKLCQDIVLKAIAESGMARNATVKGGVVMRSLSKNGHLHIECAGHLGLTSIEYKENVEPRKQEIIDFCKTI